MNTAVPGSVRDILIQARELISDPEHWTKNAWARDRYGNPVDAQGKQACSWCLLGAVKKVASSTAALQLARYKIRSLSSDGLIYFNDSVFTTHADVLRILDATIEACP